MSTNILKNEKLINLFYGIVIPLILYGLAANKIQENYKIYIIWLALFLAIYHLYNFWLIISTEKMTLSNQGSTVHHIKILDHSPGYDHASLNIKKGDIVIWKNTTQHEHTVTSKDGNFDSGYMKPGDEFPIKFSEPKKIHYYCSVHKDWMNGIINVEE